MRYPVMFPPGRQDKAAEMLSLQIVVFQAIRDGADAKLPDRGLSTLSQPDNQSCSNSRPDAMLTFIHSADFF